MNRVIVLTSGKGGVGKTTSSANIAIGLAQRGHRTVVVDFDVGLRNLDIVLGVEGRVSHDLVNVVNDEAQIEDALIQDEREPLLSILPASRTRDKDDLTEEGIEHVIESLKKLDFDFIICDSPAGIERGAFMAQYFADEAIIVVNPDPSSIRDADRMIGLLQSRSQKAKLGLKANIECLITRYDPEKVPLGAHIDYQTIINQLNVEFLGAVPESVDVMISNNQGHPVIYNTESDAQEAYKDVVLRILGENPPMRFLEIESCTDDAQTVQNKKGWFNWLRKS